MSTIAGNIALLPKLSKDSKLEEFKFWKIEFLAFLDLIITEEKQKDEQGIKFLKYAIASAKLLVDLDGRSTVKTALAKVEEQFTLIHRPPFPVSDFYALKWNTFDGTICAYIDKLRSLLFFMSNRDSKNELIIQHTLEQLTPELRILLANVGIDDLIKHLSTIPKSDTVKICASIPTTSNSSINVVCFNCGVNGHISRMCTQSKRRCEKCKKMGHQIKYCRQKNSSAATLLEEQGGH